jgi:hypothetical protein
MRFRLAALAVAAIAAVGAPAAAAPGDKFPSIEMEVKKRTKTKIPVRLTCPVERVRCAGTVSFSGRKRRAGTTYKLSANPFQFDKFKGGRSKIIDFTLSAEARRTLRDARGMKVRFVLKARYAKGPDNTVKVPAELRP